MALIEPDPQGVHVLVSIDRYGQMHVQPFNFNSKEQAIEMMQMALDALRLDAMPVPEVRQ